MTCADCTQAADSWCWGGYTNGCDGCEIRSIAGSPDHMVKAWLGRMSKTRGRDYAVAQGAAIKAERERIRKAREETYARMGVVLTGKEQEA